MVRGRLKTRSPRLGPLLSHHDDAAAAIPPVE